jgi:hypothetical protein
MAPYVFIMMAHDGIWNEELWRKYINLNNDIHVLVYISKESGYTLKTTSSQLGDKTTRNLILANNSTCSIQTKWGESSIVFVQQQLLIEAISMFPDATHFQTVSGACIPVVLPDKPLNWARENEGVSVFEMSEVKGFGLFNSEYIENVVSSYSPDIQFPLSEENWSHSFSLTPKKLKYHSQWCILSNQHVKLLNTFDFNKFNDLDKALENVSYYPELTNPIRIQRLKGRRNVRFAPDEYYFWLALRLQYKYLYQFKYTTGAVNYFLQQDSQSTGPIEWENSHSKVLHYVEVEGYEYRTHVSCQQFLCGIHKYVNSNIKDASTCFVARKFKSSSLETIGVDVPWMTSSNFEKVLEETNISRSRNLCERIATTRIMATHLAYDKDKRMTQKKRKGYQGVLNLQASSSVRNSNILNTFNANRAGSKKLNQSKRRKTLNKARALEMNIQRHAPKF